MTTEERIVIADLLATANLCLESIERNERPMCDAIHKSDPRLPAPSDFGAWRRQLKRIVSGLERLADGDTSPPATRPRNLRK